jgi:hypothetical protein
MLDYQLSWTGKTRLERSGHSRRQADLLADNPKQRRVSSTATSRTVAYN